MPATSRETRVLVLAPTRADADVTLRVLAQAGLAGEICGSSADLAREILRGAGAVIVTDDVARGDPPSELRFLLDRQPSWSELPILVLARPESPRLAALRTIPGVLLLERPVHIRSLVSAVEAALRARLRQYELRNQLEQTRAANFELQNAARAKDDFLATLSHELRNPLSALRTAADLLDRESAGPEARREARQIVRRQAMQMTRLLDDLLDVARITHGRLEIRVVRASLWSIVRSAVETVQPLLDRKQHEFTLDMPDEDLALDVDPVRMAQVLANLLTNAAKYTEAGGRISLQVESDVRRVTFRVRDNGIGIAPEAASDIFGMFAQLRPALERSDGGLGIGLALSKALVELHGGKITLKSEGPGRGSEFTVRIPLRAAAHAGVGTIGTECDAGGAADRCDIIVADDNADALESMGMLLEMEGHTVRLARDGAQALELMGARMPDAMVLDIGMPVMNGYEVAREVRRMGAPVTLIALTGWGQQSDRARTRQAGFDHHLTKPVEFAELSRLLSRRADPAAAQAPPVNGDVNAEVRYERRDAGYPA
jgi:signal transduction histidine kinase/ActR/RegA family two-component response regulator